MTINMYPAFGFALANGRCSRSASTSKAWVKALWVQVPALILTTAELRRASVFTAMKWEENISQGRTAEIRELMKLEKEMHFKPQEQKLAYSRCSLKEAPPPTQALWGIL